MSDTRKKEIRLIMELSSPKSSGHSKTKAKVCFTPIRKIRGRIASKLINRSFEDNEYSNSELNSNRATCWSGFDNQESFSIFQNVNITLYYSLDSYDKNIESINILISEDRTIGEFIQAAIENINKILQDENQNIYLDTSNSGKYEVRLSKKNGKPKLDFPYFNKSTTIQYCQIEQFSLVFDKKFIKTKEKNSFTNNNSNHYTNNKKEENKKNHNFNEKDDNKKHKKPPTKSSNKNNQEICLLF